MIAILNFHSIFSDPASCLGKRLGIPVHTKYVPNPDTTFIIFGAHVVAHILCLVPGARFILMNTEAPQSDVLRNKFYIELLRAHPICDYHPTSTDHLCTLGGRVIGGVPMEFTPYQSTLRPIDVLFVGAYSPLRASIEAALPKHLVVRFETEVESMPQLLCQAKIVLNIPFYSGLLETHRIHQALACGCHVISLGPPHPVYKNYVQFTQDLNQSIAAPTVLWGYRQLLDLVIIPQSLHLLSVI